MSSFARRLTLATLVVAAASCGGDGGTEPVSPSSVVTISAAPTGLAGSVLATAPTFEVRSASGQAIGGVPVTVAIASGGGTLAGAPTVSLAGPTPIGTWTLGTASGVQTVTVTVAGLAPLTVTATATAGAPSALDVVEGNNQAGQALVAVPSPVRVRVRDAVGNPVPDVTVTWSIDAGGGQLAGTTSVTNNLGIATAPTWTLGPAGPGQQALLASVGAITARITASQTAFSVEVRYVGATPDAATQAAFSNAAQRIRSIITGDLIDIPLNNFTPSTNCLPAGSVSPMTETIDDVVVFARVEPIDGVGSVLGSAGPCNIRLADGLTIIGAMRFDSADLANLAAEGRLENVILHEMLHVMGVGTLWANKGLLADAGSPTVRFLGPLARTACVNTPNGAAPCNTAVPAENCLDLPIGQNCGAGTQNSHWKESIFQSELLTGYLGTGVNPLSSITIQSLADLGYVVNVLLADAYQVPPPALRALLMAGPSLRMPEPFRPTERIDAAGRVTRIEHQ